MIIHTDGGCFTNPGPAVWAFVVREHEGGEIIRTESGYLPDPKSTNNISEYQALIEALKYVSEVTERYYRVYGFKPHALQLWSDSKLIVNQVNGVWSVKHESMIPLWAEAMTRIDALLLKGINVNLQHVHREENVDADAECRRLKEEILSVQK